MKNQFEEYLQDAFMELREIDGMPITKDNCEDLFENWLQDMDLDLMLAHGDKFGALCKLNAIKEFSEKLKITA